MTPTVEQLIKEAAGLNIKNIEKAASIKIDKIEAKKISEGLMKVASLPYKEAAYNSVQEIMKIASTSLDSLIIELDSRDKKINQLTKIAEIREVIDSMIDRRLIEYSGIQEKTAELLKKSDHELEIIKEAIALGSVTSKNIFFEEGEKLASATPEKRGIFDGVDGLA
jgi:hypothetical protein